MTSLSLYIRQFDPYTPAIDPRRGDKPGIIAGQNFLTDVDGPRSAFTSNFANWWQWDAVNAINMRSFKVAGKWIYANNTGLWYIDPISQLPRLIRRILTTDPYWPWTYAQVGNLHYFAQNNIGLWQYNDLTNSVVKITTPGIVKGICQSYGRLLCLSDETTFWSALDDGTDFDPSLTTGAGFQVLSLLSNKAFRIDPVADGVIITTDLGCIKGEFVQANFVFRWYVISREIFSFSPNCAVYVEHIGLIILDKTALHVTDGARPVVWEATMGYYMKTTFLDGMDITKLGNIKLSFSENFNALFVDFAPSTRQGSFQNSFVFYVPTQQWSSWQTQHSAIIDMDVSLSKQNLPGYLDVNGYMKYFTNAQYSEQLPLSGYDLAEYVWRTPSEVPVMISSIVFMGSSDINCSMFDPSLFSGKVSGLYQLNSGGTVTGYVLPHGGPNSFIDLGPFRFQEQKEADETSFISSLVIGTTSAAISIGLTEDWNTSGNSEDWNTGAFDEDWGFSLKFQDNFLLDLTATDDGFNPQIQGPERLDVIENLGAAFQYSPVGYSAVFHNMRLTAFDAGTSFSVKFVSIAGHPTGRHI